MLAWVFQSLIILFDSLRLVKHIYMTSFGYLCQGLSLLYWVEINCIKVCKLCRPKASLFQFLARKQLIFWIQYIHLAYRPPSWWYVQWNLPVCDTLAFLLFIWTRVFAQLDHNQPFYTFKWPLTVNAVWTDGLLNLCEKGGGDCLLL